MVLVLLHRQLRRAKAKRLLNDKRSLGLSMRSTRGSFATAKDPFFFETQFFRPITRLKTKDR